MKTRREVMQEMSVRELRARVVVYLLGGWGWFAVGRQNEPVYVLLPLTVADDRQARQRMPLAFWPDLAPRDWDMALYDPHTPNAPLAGEVYKQATDCDPPIAWGFIGDRIFPALLEKGWDYTQKPHSFDVVKPHPQPRVGAHNYHNHDRDNIERAILQAAFSVGLHESLIKFP